MNIPVMHDDQWGAATVSLTALINSLKLTGKSKDSVKVVLSGVGAAGVATARLLIAYGIKNIIFIDSKGVIRSDRSDLNKEKIELISNTNNYNSEAVNLADALVGADVFIGLSKPGVMTEDMVRSMGDRPIIFALANPTPEIMPELASEAGAYIIATGRSDYPNQINNSLVFPGFWKGMLEKRRGDINSLDAHKYDVSLFISIAEALANMVEDLTAQNILPDMFNSKVVDVVYNEVIK
jgi:malate dehydrogenase (oxaloacetate-decarboxylating)